MIKDGIIGQTALASPLANASCIRPKSSTKKKKLVAAVILTSLIDAFSILVIYLLVNFSNSGEILYMSKDMELPVAAQTEALVREAVVKFEKGIFYLEDEVIPPGRLVEFLVNARKKLAENRIDADGDYAITVQADRRATFKDLNQVVLASSHAGFGEIKFAVLVK